MDLGKHARRGSSSRKETHKGHLEVQGRTS